MSALNISPALPQTRSADVASGKSAEAEGNEGSGGDPFGDVFRDLSKASGESARAAGTGDAAADGTAVGQQAGKPLSLADALASVAGRRSDDSASDAATSAPSDAAPSDAATAEADAADAEAARDETADAVSTSHDRTTSQTDAAARARRMQGHQGLSALLFGRGEGENGLSPARSSSDGQGKATKAGTEADAATAQDADVQAQADAAAQIQPQTAADPATMLQALAQAQTVHADETHAEAEGDAAAQAAAVAPTEAEGAAASQTQQPMRITVLSRETHFAPIRSLAMNGGSAPSATTTATATADGAQALSGPTGDTAAASVNATGTAATPGTAQRTSADVKPWTASLPGAKTATGAATNTTSAVATDADTDGTVAAAVEKTVAGQAQTAAREATAERREANARSRADSAATAETPQTSREAARADVSQGQGIDVSLAGSETDSTLPVTGTAGIASGGVATQNLPTLRQIGAAIAAEVTTMGQAPVASATSATAQALAGPVRLLQIQLKPDDLGTVNVRMRLSSNGLEIQLRASNADTARMLEQDRAALSELLTASGITADNITIVGIDSGGSMQLTGQDAGRPFTPPETASGQADRQERAPSDQQGRGSRGENSQNGAQHDEARSRSRAADAGSDFRI